MKKSNFLKSTAEAVAACMLLFYAPAVNAQVYNPATYAESLFVSNAAIPNSALIDYTPNCTGSCGNSQLKVVTYSGNKFTANDGYGSPVTVTLPFTADPVNMDVVVGNNTARGASSHYLVGVVATAYAGASAVHLCIYDIRNVGTGSALSSTLVGNYTIDSMGQFFFPRIDIIAEYGNLFLGLPLCDKFVITYNEVGTGLSDAVIGYASSLNNPTVFTRQVIANNAYNSPDVAGIQRYFHGIDKTSVDNVALFSYISNSGNYLFYKEWDITQGTLSAQITLDNSSYSSVFTRIDAIDDYHINDPTIASPLAYYTVVNGYQTSGGIYSSVGQRTGPVRAYNNLLPIPGGLDISTPLVGSSNTVGLATVAAGPCEQYTVVYNGSYGSPDVLVQNIDWTTGYPVNYNSSLPNPFLNVNYYEANYTADDISSTGPTAVVSATCNGNGTTYAPYILVDWDEQEGAAADIYDKMTNCNIAFKSTNAAKPTEEKWLLSPNPATDMLILSCGQNVKDDKYIITDAIGKTLVQADISSEKQQIDISNIMPGMYFLRVFSNDQTIKTLKFVKD